LETEIIANLILQYNNEILLNESFNNEDEQFHQYQQNKQAHPSSYICTCTLLYYISFIFIIRKCYIFNNCYNTKWP